MEDDHTSKASDQGSSAAQSSSSRAVGNYATEEQFVAAWLSGRSPITVRFDGGLCQQRQVTEALPPPYEFGNVVTFLGSGNGAYGGNDPHWLRKTYEWANAHGFLSVNTMQVQFPPMPTMWNKSCVVLTPKLQELLKGQNSLVVADKRTILGWTYENEYETETPTSGKVKVFAGTLTYRSSTDTPLPGIALDPAELQIKIAQNPDTGKWEVVDSHLSDPAINITP